MVPQSLATRFDLQRGVDCRRETAGGWELDSLRGRLIELSGTKGGASLTVTAGLIRRAQLQSQPVAWVGVRESIFFPPDLAASGIDLGPLPVVLLPESRSVPLAAELLVRSGAFALVVIDLGVRKLRERECSRRGVREKEHSPRSSGSVRGAAPPAHGSEPSWGARRDIPLAELTRLAGLAKHHETLLVFLTQKPRQASSLGALVSLRAEVHRRDLGEGRYACELEVIKDKRRAPGWTHTELCRGPDGLC